MPTSATPNDQTTQVNTGGGSAIGHDVTIDKGDFVGRDKIEQHFHYHGASSSVSTSSQDALLFIPFLRKSATEFVGRDAELAELHEKLQQSQMVGVRPAAALTGLGGIGKTQLAVEYAYRYQASYPGGIFWINAADLNQVRSKLVETAERMGLGTTDRNTTDNTLLVALVKRCQQQPATLLCFDNAPDAVILWRRLTQELNTATLGAAILVTTRRGELPPNMAALDLRRLSDSTVRQLLATARPDLLTDPDLPRLLARLGGLPLIVSLVANALRNSPDATIADYLAALTQHGEELVHEALDARVADYDLYREVYTRTLLPVLREQWERLCQQPNSGNAQLLLRIAGQLPEAAEIPMARLGLLAGLQDEKVIKPLTSAIQTLWKVALIEELKADAIRLHPLVRNFAATLTPTNERTSFRNQRTELLATAYTDIARLEQECDARGIAELLGDIRIGLDLLDSSVISFKPTIISGQTQTSDYLQALFSLFRREARNLTAWKKEQHPHQFAQQLLFHNMLLNKAGLVVKAQQYLANKAKSYWRTETVSYGVSIIAEQTLMGHTNFVNAVAVLDRSHIVSASADTILKIWDLDTNTLMRNFKGHKSYINAVAVLDSSRIISASADRTVLVWDYKSGEILQTLNIHESYVTAIVVLNSSHIVSTDSDGKFIIWDVDANLFEQILIEPKYKVCSVAALDEDHIVAALDNGTLKIWNLKSGKFIRTLSGHQAAVNIVVSYNYDLQLIISASGDRTIKLWDYNSGKCVKTFIGHTDSINSVAIIDRDRIVSASADHTLKIWNLKSGQLEQTLVGHDSYVNAVAVIENSRVVSASADHTLKIWNLDPETSSPATSDRRGRITALATLDTMRVAAISDKHTLQIWNLVTGVVEHKLDRPGSKIRELAILAPNQIALVVNDSILEIWNPVTNKIEKTLTGEEKILSVVALPNSTDQVLLLVENEKFMLWNLVTGEIERILRTEAFDPLFEHMTPINAQQIVFNDIWGDLFIWNLPSGECVKTSIETGFEIKKIVILDKYYIINVKHELQVRNSHSGAIEQTLTGHSSHINDVAVLGTKYVVSASDDRSIKAWDIETGRVVASVMLDNIPQCVAIVQQGEQKLVVAGDAGGALYCLELAEPVAGN